MIKQFTKLLCGLMLLIISGATKAQVSSYTFAASSGTYTDITGGTPVATSVSIADFLDDFRTSVAIPIGFNFLYDGATYTQVIAGSDGFISFNSSASTITTNNLATSTSSRPLVAPLWDDLDGASGSGAANYITTGSAGSRIFTIEWKNWQWNYNATGATISFQVKLYEGSNKIEFIYRPEAGTVNSGSASIGITGAATGSGNYLSLNNSGTSPTVSSTSETTTISTKPASGQTYTFTPPACIAPTPTITTTSNSATITFSSPGNSFIIEYGTTGFTPGTGATAGTGGTIVTTTSSPVTINGLNNSTVYDVYIRQNCTSAGNGYSTNSGKTTFYLLPANDDCASATVATVNTDGTCTNLFPGTVGGATASAGPASTCGTYDDDVWYKFVATATIHTIALQNITGSTTDLTHQVLDGCGAAANILVCSDPNTSTVTGLTVGNTYYIRVATYTATAGQTSAFNLCVSVPPNMVYTSSTATQQTGTASQGSTNNTILRLSVVTTNSGNPLSASQLVLNTNGTAVPTDITAARVYYTGISTTFAPTTQFGSAISNPSGTLTFNGSQTLVAGTNYFWLVYDISCSATTTDVIDAEFTSVTVGGTAYTPTISAPAGNKTVAVSTGPTTIANGNWNDPATWSCGTVPTSTTNVTINHAVTLTGTNNAASNVTINSTGSLTLSTGTQLTLGPAGGGNKTLTNNGTLTVSGGILNINGNLVIASGSTFNQSGGDINVDGNDGTAGGSVAIGSDLIGIGTSGTNYAAGVLNLTGGTITVVDPHFSGTATSTGGAALAFRAATSTNRNLGTGHTLRIGGTTGTNASTAGFGFYVDTYVNNAILQLGNVEVNGGTGNRSLYTNAISAAGAINIGGNLTVNSGCRMTDTSGTTLAKTIAGNVINNGTIVWSQTTVFAVLPGNSTTAVAVTTPQSVSGSGVFQNASSSATANVSSLTIFNISTGGVTLNVPLTLSGTLTLSAGKVNTTATNLLTLGFNATSVGTLSYATNAWINGPFKRWISAATGSRAFPVGNTDSVQLAITNYTAAPTAAGTLTAQWIGTNPGFPNATPLTEGALIVNRVSPKGYWQIDAADGLAGGTYIGSFSPKGYSDIIDYTKLVLVKRPSAGGDWTLDGTHVTTTGSNVAPLLSRTGMSGFSQFAIGGQNNVALPITLQYLKGLKAATGNALNWKVNCTSVSITMNLERSSDSRNFKSIGSITATQARCGQPFDYTDATPLKGTNYYRLKMIDVDGAVTYSPIVAIINGGTGAELVGIYPTVVRDEAFLSVAASRSTKLQINITDMGGRIIKTISQTVANGSSLININTANLSTGVYNITGMLDGVQTKTLRFMKQ